MDLDELKRLMVKEPDALAHALRFTGQTLEGRVWEYQAKTELEKLGFKDLTFFPMNHYYDYSGERDGCTCYIQVKVRDKSVTRNLSLKGRIKLAEFILKNRYYILTKEGLSEPDQRTINLLRRVTAKPKPQPVIIEAHIEPARVINRGIVYHPLPRVD